MVVIKSDQDALGGVVVALDLEGARADEVGANAPVVASGLTGGCRVDGSIELAEHAHERGVDLRQGDGEVRVVNHGEAGKLGGLVVDDVLGADDVRVGVGLGLQLEQTLEGVLDVIGGEDGAIVELDVALEFEGVGEAILGNLRQSGEKQRLDLLSDGVERHEGVTDVFGDADGVGGELGVHVGAGVRGAKAQNGCAALVATSSASATASGQRHGCGCDGSANGAAQEGTTGQLGRESAG